MMCVGTGSIVCEQRRAEVRERLEAPGRTVVDLTAGQIAEFAGNALELQGRDGRVLAMSSRALRALRSDQIVAIEHLVTPVGLDIPTIELAGGSVRCMLAEMNHKTSSSATFAAACLSAIGQARISN